MRTYIYTMMIAMMGFGAVSAQTSMKEIRQDVMDEELLKNWKTGESKTSQQQEITKLKDNGDGSTRTNLMYTPPGKMVFTHPIFMSMPVNINKAGIIYIMVDRESKKGVNASNYTIQVFDKTGRVELYSITPNNEPGKEFKYGVWYNHFGIEIPGFVGTDFQVRVTDNTSGTKVLYDVSSNVPEYTIEMQRRFASK